MLQSRARRAPAASELQMLAAVVAAQGLPLGSRPGQKPDQATLVGAQSRAAAREFENPFSRLRRRSSARTGVAALRRAAGSE